ncbi:hypothetical protein ACH42_11150 [Endozoicomonas sp. (ex Bugula neritina AB1)]|nr:hypothetical protein ACH42_11150 [Endozoicomonas sp. (ex Bugula neritina AB1)]
MHRYLIPTLLATVLATGCNQIPSKPTELATQVNSQTQQLPQLEIPYQKFTLDNGLTVVVHEDRKAPVVAVNTWYKVGSKDEPFGKTGFAHLFEHLMFNGSENFDQDFFIPFLSAGATDMNGTTNNDRTNYFQTVPTQALDMALWMESDRMGHFIGAITQEKLDIQRGVVQNEKRQGENIPYGKTWEQMAKDTFPAGHPYSWSVIGSMEDLDAANLKDVKEWFKTYYGPSNAVLVLAGDIDAKTAREKVSKYFADIAPGKPLSVPGQWIAKRTGEKRRLMQDYAPQPRISMSWNTPEIGSQTDAELELLASVLGGGKSSRLYKRLVEDEQLVTSVSAFVYSRQLAGQFVISADLKPDSDRTNVEMIIRQELEKIIESGLTTNEVNQARFSYLASFIRNSERVGGFGGKSDILANGEVYHNNPGFYKNYHHKLNASTPESIQSSASEWLSDGVYVQTILPFPKLSAGLESADRSKLPQIKESPTLELPEIQRVSLSNGMKVVLASRLNTSLVSLRMQFDGGLSSHQQYGSGVPDFTLEMLKEGTVSLPAAGIQKKLDSLGSELTTSTERDHSVIDMSSLSTNLAPSLELLADVIINPAFNESNINRLKEQRRQNISQEIATPHSMISRELPKILYKSEHPYSTPGTGTGNLTTLDTIDQSILKSWYQDWLRPDNATLVVVGDITMDKLIPQLEKYFTQWETPETPLTTIDFPLVMAPKSPRVYLLNQPEAQQSTIAVAQLLPGTSASNLDEELSFNVFNDLLGGKFTSRINMNLREDKRWSYGARSYSQDAKSQRPYLIYTSVQTDKTGPALAEVKKELDLVFSAKPASSAEVKKYSENRQKEQAGRYETNSRLLSAISRMITYDLPDDYLNQYGQILKTIDTDSVRLAGEKRLNTEHMSWVIVGDLKKIEKEVKELNLGDVEIIIPQS